MDGTASSMGDDNEVGIIRRTTIQLNINNICVCYGISTQVISSLWTKFGSAASIDKIIKQFAETDISYKILHS